ncbi:MAG: HAMP domain-containing protein [bacterium]|nr:HAMP domain-containing protein [bacterium]
MMAGTAVAGTAVVAAVAALASLALISWWLNRRVLRPLRDLAKDAERLAGGDLASRAQAPAAVGEIAALARSLDLLAERLRVQGRELAEERQHWRGIADRELAEERRQAETRRDLVANVSHELKTPLTAIRGYAESLEDGALEDPEIGPRFVSRILDQCQRLEALLRDQLALARLEQIEQIADAEVIDLGEAARRAVEALNPLAREREVDLILAADDSPRIRGSRSELDNLVLNLVENAIKYNRPGGEVRMALATDGDEAVIEVADTGIGIPEAAVARIFERFYRVDKGRAREQGGTGLGLAIVKHAARLLGGRVEVESRLGEGSVFRVRLPGAAA